MFDPKNATLARHVDTYDFRQARDEYIAQQRLLGYVPDVPGPNELQIDIDDYAQRETFDNSFEILRREISHRYGVGLTYTENPSKSGGYACHIRVSLPFNVDPFQRIALQAALGSDPTRELLSFWRAHLGDAFPTLLMEPAPPPAPPVL